MAKSLLKTYVFNPGIAGTGNILFPGKIDMNSIMLITNVTRNTILYNFSDVSHANTLAAFTRSNHTSFPQALQNSDGFTTVTLQVNTSTHDANDKLQVFIDVPKQIVQFEGVGKDAFERTRVSAPLSMLDADFEYGLQPTKWQVIDILRGYPSIYEVPGTDIQVTAIVSDASAGTNFVGQSLITITTATPHGYAVGQPITVKGLANTITGFARAEGTFIINAVPTTTTLNYYSKARVGTTGGIAVAASGNSGTSGSTSVTIGAQTAIGTLSGVAIATIGGSFTCTAPAFPLQVGQALVITGTYGGTGSITGYATGTTYYITTTNGSTTFTLSTTPNGGPVTTAVGTPTGLTYTLSNTYQVGDVVVSSASGVATGATIISQTSGTTGMAGVYVLNTANIATFSSGSITTTGEVVSTTYSQLRKGGFFTGAAINSATFAVTTAGKSNTTTTTALASKGATVINVTSATGLAVGDYLAATLASNAGAIATNTRITAINTLAITIDTPLVTDLANGASVVFGTFALITVTFSNPHGLLPGSTILTAITSSGTNFSYAQGPFYINTVGATTITYNARAVGSVQNTLVGSVYARPDCFYSHRPFDGGVQLGTGGPAHGAQAIRQSKKYIRYQSGKSINYNTGLLLAPSYDIRAVTASGTNATVTTTATASSGASTLTVASGTGIAAGMLVYGPGIPFGTQVISSYTTGASVGLVQYGTQNEQLTTAALSTTPITISAGLTVNTDDVDHGLQVGGAIQVYGVNSTTAGYNGNYIVNAIIDERTFVVMANSSSTSSAASSTTNSGTAGQNVLTVTVASGTLSIGQAIAGTGVAANTIVAQISGAGPYTVTTSRPLTATISNTTLTFTGNGSISNTTADIGTPCQISLLNWSGATVRSGTFDDQNGQFWQYDGQVVSVGYRSATFQLAGVGTVNSDQNSVTGLNTRFTTQIAEGDRIVIKGMTHVVSSVTADNQMYVTPDYRGASTAVGVKIARVRDTIVPQSQWNVDRLDGSNSPFNPSGYRLDVNKMQMVGIQWTWYGAGFMEWMLRGPDGNYVTCHRIKASNVNTEAYMRSGNQPVRYEVLNEGARTYTTATATSGETTSITVSDATSFPQTGIVWLDGELISYTGKTATTLTGLGRDATLTYYAAGANRSFTGAAAAAVPVNTGVILISSTATPIISHWGSAFLQDGGFDSDRGYIFNYQATNIPISTRKYTAFGIRLAPSVSNAIIGDLGARELLNRAQLLLSGLEITAGGSTNANSALVIEGVLNPSNYPSTLSNITWNSLQGNAAAYYSGGQPSFCQIAQGSSMTFDNLASLTYATPLVSGIASTLASNTSSGTTVTLAAAIPAGNIVPGYHAVVTGGTGILATATTAATYNAGSTALTVNSGTSFAIGKAIMGEGIPVGTTILSGSGVSWVMSAAATAPGTIAGGSLVTIFTQVTAVNSTTSYTVGTTPETALSASNQLAFFLYGTRCSGVNTTTTIFVDNTANLKVGMLVSIVVGTGTIAAGTTITAINNTTSFTVSAAPSVAVASGTWLSFTPAGSASGGGGNSVIAVQNITNLASGDDAAIPALTTGTNIAGNTKVVSTSSFAGTATQGGLVTLNNQLAGNIPANTSIVWSRNSYAQPGETVFSFIAGQSGRDAIDLSPLKELTNTPLGGRGTFPNGPDVLMINVYITQGTPILANLVLRWSEAQA